MDIKDYKLRDQQRKHDRALERQKIQRAKERKKDIDRAAYEDFIATAKIMAKTGDIGINSTFARSVLSAWQRGEAETTHSEELKLYITACDAYKALQESFAAFYNRSGAFERICKDIESGAINPYGSWNSKARIRFAESGFRRTDWQDQEKCNSLARAILAR